MSSKKSQDGSSRVAQLDSAVQGAIGEMLRQYYASLVSAPVPTSICRVLEELERQERDRKTGENAERSEAAAVQSVAEEPDQRS